jgi:2-polyprenyl-3-methyl-5-hydroxy-6-metoxy-1,4-benzoquinol methylase
VSKDNQAILRAILEAFDEDQIGLPPAPVRLTKNNPGVSQVMQTLSDELGAIADSDYFKCSRERFSHILQLVLETLPRGSRLLDVGNAPGYLAQALHLAGYSVSGVNLSEAWNSTYPDPAYLDRFDVRACNIEKCSLPYADHTFDGIVFTEVLEHIAIKRPEDLLPDFKRVLKPDGLVLFSTPNVCNLSNISALATGKNVFWPTKIFYGSTDRHNREWTPAEVKQLFVDSGFEVDFFYGMNDHANWRLGAAEEIYVLLGDSPKSHALLRNTIVGVFRSIAEA